MLCYVKLMLLGDAVAILAEHRTCDLQPRVRVIITKKPGSNQICDSTYPSVTCSHVRAKTDMAEHYKSLTRVDLSTPLFQFLWSYMYIRANSTNSELNIHLKQYRMHYKTIQYKICRPIKLCDIFYGT